MRTAIERFVVDANLHRTYTESTYHEQLLRTLGTLGVRGLAVILGRGSAFVLRAERTLRVLVVAPHDERLERLAKRHDLSNRDASPRLDREDAERVAFNRHHFHVDANDPSLYDLVVNTGTLTVEGAADLVEQAARRRFPKLGSTTQSSSSGAASP